MLTRCGAIRLIEGCPRLNIQGISPPLSGLMGRINNAARSCQDACGIPMLPLAAAVSAGAPALLGGCWREINVFPLLLTGSICKQPHGERSWAGYFEVAREKERHSDEKEIGCCWFTGESKAGEPLLSAWFRLYRCCCRNHIRSYS